MYLVNFNDNWADEIDVHEATIITEDEYQALEEYLQVNKIRAYDEAYEDESCSAEEYAEFEESFDSFFLEVYLGTNESIDYCGLSGIKAIWEALEFLPITEDEAAVVRKFNLVGNSHIISGLIDEAMIDSGE